MRMEKPNFKKCYIKNDRNKDIFQLQIRQIYSNIIMIEL